MSPYMNTSTHYSVFFHSRAVLLNPQPNAYVPSKGNVYTIFMTPPEREHPTYHIYILFPRESNPGSSRGSPLRYRCATQAPCTYIHIQTNIHIHTYRHTCIYTSIIINFHEPITLNKTKYSMNIWRF